MRNIVLLLILSIIAFSCSNDDDLKSGSAKNIVFGEIYGECGGDCRNLYLLTEQGIYQDSNTDTAFGNWENTSFENKELPLNKFELAKPLLEFPIGLIESNDTIVVDKWADFDYFILIELNGKSKTWIFDEVSENTNSEIKNYFENLILINGQLQD